MATSIKRNSKVASPAHSRGVAALATSLSLVVISTIITLAAGRVSSNEQRNAANEVRATEAAVLADGGINRGAIYLRQNVRQIRSAVVGSGWLDPTSTSTLKWTPCNSMTITPPCGDGKTNVFDNTWTTYPNLPNLKAVTDPLQGDFTSHFVARAAVPGQAAPSGGTFNVISEGRSGDTLGRSLTRQSFVFQPFLARRPDAPLIAAGTIGLKGTLSVVANPNGGGPGVPLSAWSGGDIEVGGSVQTCHISEYLNDNTPDEFQQDSSGNTLAMCPKCRCPVNQPIRQISNPNKEGIDILDVENPQVGANPNSPYFPPDLFEYVFGVAEASYQTIKDQAQVINGASCGGLGPSSEGLIWAVGNCDVGSQTVGSFASPVILVVENGDFQMNANGQFLGVLFSFTHSTANPTASPYTVKLTGSPTFYGSVISNRNIDGTNGGPGGAGSYVARYDKAVLDNLSNSLGAASRIVPVAGSWRNY